MKQKTESNIRIMETMKETSTCSSQEYVLENVADTLASNEGKHNIVSILDLKTDDGNPLPESEITKVLNPNNYGVHLVVDGKARTVKPLTYNQDGQATPSKIGFSDQAYFVRDSKSSGQTFRVWQNNAVTGG
jgi:hypothetical protein